MPPILKTVQLLCFFCELAFGIYTPRYALFWLEPYANLTSVDDYVTAWSQWRANARPGYIGAGSAYALKDNATLGYADTDAGEGMYRVTMDMYGFPAMKQLNLTACAMVYMTHEVALNILFTNPSAATAFIDSLIAKLEEQELAGVDIDYEPQTMVRVAAALTNDSTVADPFLTFMTELAAATTAHGFFLSVDLGGYCASLGPAFCAAFGALQGLNQMNTEDTFGIHSLADFQRSQSDNAGAGLGQVWAPGFEPGNVGESLFRTVLQYASSASGNVSRIATWQVHECNVGPQPQWLFDAVNSFLDAPLLS